MDSAAMEEDDGPLIVPQGGLPNKTNQKTLVLEHVAPATRLLEKRRQMFEVQEALEAQKTEFARKEEVFKRREEGLKKKDAELQDALVRFSKFLQENNSKRTRAEKKAADEVKSRLQKEAEIEKLAGLVEELQKEKARTCRVVEQNMRYHKYLEAVLDTADEYHEINDLLMRHATLEATNSDLKQQARVATEETEGLRAELQAYSKSKMNEILNLNNEISRLKKDLEAQEKETGALRARMDYALQNESAKTLEHGQVCMATENLFARCIQRSKVNHPPFTSPVEQLSVIGDFMTDLAFTIKQFKAGQGKKEQTGGKEGKSPSPTGIEKKEGHGGEKAQRTEGGGKKETAAAGAG